MEDSGGTDENEPRSSQYMSDYDSPGSSDPTEPTLSRYNLLTEEEQFRVHRIRAQLKFFFMNPLEKWKVKRFPPIKLIIQILKIIIATVQVNSKGPVTLLF